MKNYLLDSILTLFDRIEYYKGYVFHIDHDIQKFTQTLIEGIDKESTVLIKGSRLVISDFTGESDNGWEINFPLPTTGYKVTNKNYLDMNRQLIQSVSAILVVQSYEAIESFLKGILISYFQNNHQIAFETIGKANCIWNRSIVDWKKTVRRLNQGVNNKELLKIIRLLSPEFQEAESDNLKNVDLSHWFNAISISRHCIVHSESILKNDEYNKLKEYEISVLNYFFEIEDLEAENRKMSISAQQASSVMEFMCEYAFQIFKWLSISQKLEWRILKNMKINEA